MNNPPPHQFSKIYLYSLFLFENWTFSLSTWSCAEVCVCLLELHRSVCVCVCVCVCMYAHCFVFWVCCCCCSVSKLCLTLCDPTDCSRPGSSVHGISQVRILEWVAISFSRGSCRPRDQNCTSSVFCIGRWVLPQLSHWGRPVFLVIFIYLTARGLSCGLWNLQLWHVRPSSLTRV